jgi:hypothetical protein
MLSYLVTIWLIFERNRREKRPSILSPERRASSSMMLHFRKRSRPETLRSETHPKDPTGILAMTSPTAIFQTTARFISFFGGWRRFLNSLHLFAFVSDGTPPSSISTSHPARSMKRSSPSLSRTRVPSPNKIWRVAFSPKPSYHHTHVRSQIRLPWRGQDPISSLNSDPFPVHLHISIGRDLSFTKARVPPHCGSQRPCSHFEQRVLHDLISGRNETSLEF